MNTNTAPAAAQSTTPAAAAPNTQNAPVSQDPTPKPTETQPKPQENDDFAHRFATLSRRQRAITDREKSLEAREAKIREIEERDALFDKDPVGYITKRGKSLDDVLKQVAGSEETSDDKVSRLQKIIEDMQKEREDEKKNKEDAEKNSVNEKAVADFKNQIHTFVSGDAERFEAIMATESFDDVFEVCELYFEKHGEIPPIEWAADEVEKILLENARKFSRLKKLAPSQITDAVDGAKETANKAQETEEVPTINNKLAPEALTKKTRTMSDEESKAEAAKLLRWN